jgi:hypothetical protein
MFPFFIRLQRLNNAQSYQEKSTSPALKAAIDTRKDSRKAFGAVKPEVRSAAVGVYRPCTNRLRVPVNYREDQAVIIGLEQLRSMVRHILIVGLGKGLFYVFLEIRNLLAPYHWLEKASFIHRRSATASNQKSYSPHSSIFHIKNNILTLHANQHSLVRLLALAVRSLAHWMSL